MLCNAACNTDSAYPAGQICSAGFCRAGCGAYGDCPAGQICAAGQCIASCSRRRAFDCGGVTMQCSTTGACFDCPAGKYNCNGTYGCESRTPCR